MKARTRFIAMLLLTGCAGWDRSCSSSCATSFGADWLIVQYRFDGEPINCWQLNNTSVTNEPSSDGIYWKDSSTGHLVHISGWYNRVQVENGNFETAAAVVGVDVNRCPGGKYMPAPETRGEVREPSENEIEVQ